MSNLAATENVSASITEIPKREAKPDQAKPKKTLPTDRINVARQLDVLRAYAAASNKGTRAVPASEIAEIMKMAENTLSLIHPFFVSIGLLQRADTATFTPSAELINFLNAYQWSPETASHKLADSMKQAWFGTVLMPRMDFGPMDEDGAIRVLAESCSAAPQYRNQLRAILNLMVACGAIERDGGNIRAVRKDQQEARTTTVESAPESPRFVEPIEPRTARVATTFGQAPEGGVQFSVNVHVDMAEFANWRPERIAAFFGGIAQVLAAKANIEKEGGKP